MNRKRQAFTIVELLVVILIISMLGVFVVPRMFKGLGKAKHDISKSKMAIIESAVARFHFDCGQYPEGLDSLLEEPTDVEEGKWAGPYLKRSEILDAWENEYIYVQPGEVNPSSFDLISYGADGLPGGEGENEDIYND